MSTTLFSQCLWLKYWQIISTWNFFMLFNVKDSLDQIWAYAHAVLLKKTVFPAWVGIEVVIYYIRVMYKNFQYSCELANFVLLSLYVFCWSVMWSLLKMYVLGHWKEGKKTIRWQEKQPGSTPCFSVLKNIHNTKTFTQERVHTFHTRLLASCLLTSLPSFLLTAKPAVVNNRAMCVAKLFSDQKDARNARFNNLFRNTFSFKIFPWQRVPLKPYSNGYSF